MTLVLPDVVACCDRVAILHEGALRYEGRLADPAGAGIFVRTSKSIDAGDWLELPIVADATPAAAGGTAWRIRLRDGATTSMLAAAIVERAFGLEELRAGNAALEETFMEIAAGSATAVAA